MDRDRGGGLDVALVSSPPDLEVRVTIAYSDSFFSPKKDLLILKIVGYHTVTICYSYHFKIPAAADSNVASATSQTKPRTLTRRGSGGTDGESESLRLLRPLERKSRGAESFRPRSRRHRTIGAGLPLSLFRILNEGTSFSLSPLFFSPW